MKKRDLEFDGNKFFKIVLAGLIVFDVPPLIEGVTGKQYSGITDDIIGAGVGAVIGYLAKDNMILNASLAIAAFDIVNGLIQSPLEKVIGSVKGATLPAGAPGAPGSKQTVTFKPSVNKPSAALASYVNMPRNGLSAYVDNTAAGLISSFQNYRDSYRVN